MFQTNICGFAGCKGQTTTTTEMNTNVVRAILEVTKLDVPDIAECAPGGWNSSSSRSRSRSHLRGVRGVRFSSSFSSLRLTLKHGFVGVCLPHPTLRRLPSLLPVLAAKPHGVTEGLSSHWRRPCEGSLASSAASSSLQSWIFPRFVFRSCR